MQVVFSPGAEIKFEGTNNFRELGGYRAADGRQVKYGLLYRGGNLDLLKSEADHARLASLGLREILDLRSAGESAAHPDPAVPGAHYQRVCGMRNADGTEMDFSGQGIERLRQEMEAFERSVGRPVHDFEWFSALYREMPFRNPAYHALFALLEGRRVPVLFHCSCGKDRTGIGAMLILLALGVSRADALADYMLTNVYRREIIERFLADKPHALYDAARTPFQQPFDIRSAAAAAVQHLCVRRKMQKVKPPQRHGGVGKVHHGDHQPAAEAFGVSRIFKK